MTSLLKNGLVMNMRRRIFFLYFVSDDGEGIFAKI